MIGFCRNHNMPSDEHVILSQARKILAQITGVFASIQQLGSLKHQEAVRVELVKHLDAAERQKVPLADLISFVTTLQCKKGVEELLADLALGLISKSSEEGLCKYATNLVVRSYFTSNCASHEATCLVDTSIQLSLTTCLFCLTLPLWVIWALQDDFATSFSFRFFFLPGNSSIWELGWIPCVDCFSGLINLALSLSMPVAYLYGFSVLFAFTHCLLSYHCFLFRNEMYILCILWSRFLCIDNENIEFSGWPDRYFGEKGSIISDLFYYWALFLAHHLSVFIATSFTRLAVNMYFLWCSSLDDHLTSVAPERVVQVHVLAQLTSSDCVFKIKFNAVGISSFNQCYISHWKKYFRGDLPYISAKTKSLVTRLQRWVHYKIACISHIPSPKSNNY